MAIKYLGSSTIPNAGKYKDSNLAAMHLDHVDNIAGTYKFVDRPTSGVFSYTDTSYYSQTFMNADWIMFKGLEPGTYQLTSSGSLYYEISRYNADTAGDKGGWINCTLYLRGSNGSNISLGYQSLDGSENDERRWYLSNLLANKQVITDGNISLYPVVNWNSVGGVYFGNRSACFRPYGGSITVSVKKIS